MMRNGSDDKGAERLAAEARAQGVSVEVYVQEILARQTLGTTGRQRLQSIREAVDQILEFAKGISWQVFGRRTSSPKAANADGDFRCGCLSGLGLVFRGEAGSWTDELLERLRQGDRYIIPAHWPTEILNGLLVASRRKRIKTDQPTLFWDELTRLPIEAEPPLTAAQAVTVLSSSRKAQPHGI